METQKIFFEIAKEKLSPQFRLADVICDLLNIGSDSAYRRIRGEKELTITELKILCAHFDISMDAILNYKDGGVIFRHIPLDLSDLKNYHIYMRQFSEVVETLALSKEKEIYFTAEDIPIFHFLPFTELTFFKVYAWYNSVCNLPVTYDEFVRQLENKDALRDIYKKMFYNYCKIPSSEIWTNNTIDSILRLLDYYYDMKCFEQKDTLVILCNQLLKMIETAMQWAEQKTKNNKEAFRLYLSPVNPENSFMLLKNNGKTSATIKLYTINGITTSNRSFCEETEKWIKNTITKSLLLSGASARERFKFFQSLNMKVNTLLEKFKE